MLRTFWTVSRHNRRLFSRLMATREEEIGWHPLVSSPSLWPLSHYVRGHKTYSCQRLLKRTQNELHMVVEVGWCLYSRKLIIVFFCLVRLKPKFKHGRVRSSKLGGHGSRTGGIRTDGSVFQRWNSVGKSALIKLSSSRITNLDKAPNQISDWQISKILSAKTKVGISVPQNWFLL